MEHGYAQDRDPPCTRPSGGLLLPSAPDASLPYALRQRADPPFIIADLTNRITALQADFNLLEERIIQGERTTDRLEQEARQLVLSGDPSGSTQRNPFSDAGGHPAGLAPNRQDPAGGQQNLLVQRLLTQLETSEHRLSNQEQAIQTIAMVIQSMSNSLDLSGEASSFSRGAYHTQASSHAMDENREMASQNRAQWSVTGDVAYVLPEATPQAQAWSPPAGASLDLLQGGPNNAAAAASSEDDFPSLQRNGEQMSTGSKKHPDYCRPCAFYCFSKRGCKKGLSCEYCHMLHISRSNRRLLSAEPSNSSRRPRDPPRKGLRPGPRLGTFDDERGL